MTSKRYARMIMYKSALDNNWAKKDRLDLYDDNYERVLGEAKLAGFKVLRNSKGEHKLIDTCKSNSVADFMEMFADAARRSR